MHEASSRPEAAPDHDTAPPRYMGAVKAGIATMAVLIVLGFAYIGVEVYRRATDPEYRAQAEASRLFGANRAEVVATNVRRGETALLLPPGAVISTTVPVGNRLAVTVAMADGTQVLYFINPSQNELVEFLRTRPAE